MTGKLMLAAGMLVLFTSVQAAPTPGVTSAQEDAVARKKAEKEELAKLQELESKCAELRVRIQKKRVQLLKNNPKLTKMYMELVRQARELALELDSDREIQELNDAFSDADKKLRQLKQERQKKKELEERKNGLLK